MTDSEPEDEAPDGGVANERGSLRTGVGVTQVDVGDPRPDLDASRSDTHQSGGGDDVVVGLGGDDRVEACLLGFPCDRLRLGRAPAHAGNHGQG